MRRFSLIQASFSWANAKASVSGVRCGSVIVTRPSSRDTRNDNRRDLADRRREITTGGLPNRTTLSVRDFCLNTTWISALVRFEANGRYDQTRGKLQKPLTRLNECGTAREIHEKSDQERGLDMPKEEWGVKRICPTSGKRFYDLKKTPIISPYTGETVIVDANTRTQVAVAEKKKPVEESEVLDDQDEIILDGDDDDDAESSSSDDLLDDDDEDTVSLDEIADVAADDDDS